MMGLTPGRPDGSDRPVAGRGGGPHTEHFAGLDLLRGVAAIGVVLYHCAGRFDLPWLFPHGYLAVDFFFALSGFVLARAYEGRISAGSLPLRRFALLRVVRLLPLIVLGTLLAAVVEVGRPGVADQHAHLRDAGLALVMGSALIPTLWSTTLEATVFPLNGPAWSLFLEVVGNAAFALWARMRAPSWPMALVMTASAVAVLAGVARYGEVGYGAVPDGFWYGFARLGWSFTAGLVLYRVRRRAPVTPFAIPTLALVAVLLVPHRPGIDDWFDAVAVLVALPAIVWIAAASPIASALRRWCAWSGDLSYPVYALHYPVVRLSGVLVLKVHLAAPARLGVAVGVTALTLGIGALAFSRFDKPLRGWLTVRLAARRSPRGAIAAAEAPTSV